MTKGFTLVELIIVIAIISILTSVIMTTFTGSANVETSNTNCFKYETKALKYVPAECYSYFKEKFSN